MTAVVRPVDSFGRIVLPKEIVKQLEDSENKLSFEIFTDDNKIILKKFKSACFFCNSSDNLITYKDKSICKECIDNLNVVKKVNI